MGNARYELIWLDMWDDTIDFYYKEGRFPRQGEEGNAGRLASWISDQRTAKQCLDEGKPCTNKMTPERISILESMSWWVWDAQEAAWEANFEELKEYVSKYGEIPPVSHPTLGRWINTQRMAYKAWEAPLRGEVEKYTGDYCIMNDERANKLESLPHWSWEPYEDNWEAKYQALTEYVCEHNKIPPQSHPTLGDWVRDQRRAYRAWQAPLRGEADKYPNETHTMNEERANKLESLPHWSWEPNEDNWEANYQALVEYVAEHNKIPPQSHPTLGRWVDRQRRAYRAWQARLNGEADKYKNVDAIMIDERANKLESLPHWSWEPNEDNWEAKYQALTEYVREHNKIPPRSHPTLGRWINAQRMAYKAWQARLKGEADKYKDVTNVMNEERARKLEAVPHWKWDMRG